MADNISLWTPNPYQRFSCSIASDWKLPQSCWHHNPQDPRLLLPPSLGLAGNLSRSRRIACKSRHTEYKKSNKAGPESGTFWPTLGTLSFRFFPVLSEAQARSSAWKHLLAHSMRFPCLHMERKPQGAGNSLACSRGMGSDGRLQVCNTKYYKQQPDPVAYKTCSPACSSWLLPGPLPPVSQQFLEYTNEKSNLLHTIVRLRQPQNVFALPASCDRCGKSRKSRKSQKSRNSRLLPS